jgi:hypothetical protein
MNVSFHATGDTTRRAEAESFYKKGNRTLSVAMRPVYHRKADGASIFADQADSTDTLLFHDGVKWTIAKTTQITSELGKNPTDDQILLFFEKFHTMYVK